MMSNMGKEGADYTFKNFEQIFLENQNYSANLFIQIISNKKINSGKKLYQYFQLENVEAIVSLIENWIDNPKNIVEANRNIISLCKILTHLKNCEYCGKDKYNKACILKLKAKISFIHVFYCEVGRNASLNVLGCVNVLLAYCKTITVVDYKQIDNDIGRATISFLKNKIMPESSSAKNKKGKELYEQKLYKKLILAFEKKLLEFFPQKLLQQQNTFIEMQKVLNHWCGSLTSYILVESVQSKSFLHTEIYYLINTVVEQKFLLTKNSLSENKGVEPDSEKQELINFKEKECLIKSVKLYNENNLNSNIIFMINQNGLIKCDFYSFKTFVADNEINENNYKAFEKYLKAIINYRDIAVDLIDRLIILISKKMINSGNPWNFIEPLLKAIATKYLDQIAQEENYYKINELLNKKKCIFDVLVNYGMEVKKQMIYTDDLMLDFILKFSNILERFPKSVSFDINIRQKNKALEKWNSENIIQKVLKYNYVFCSIRNNSIKQLVSNIWQMTFSAAKANKKFKINVLLHICQQSDYLQRKPLFIVNNIWINLDFFEDSIIKINTQYNFAKLLDSFNSISDICITDNFEVVIKCFDKMCAIDNFQKTETNSGKVKKYYCEVMASAQKFAQLYIKALIKEKKFILLNNLLNEKQRIFRLKNRDNHFVSKDFICQKEIFVEILHISGLAEKLRRITENEYSFIKANEKIATFLGKSIIQEVLKNCCLFKKWVEEELIARANLYWQHAKNISNLNENNKKFRQKIITCIITDNGRILQAGSIKVAISYFCANQINKYNEQHYNDLIDLFHSLQDMWVNNDYNNLIKFFETKNILYYSKVKRGLCSFSEKYLTFLITKKNHDNLSYFLNKKKCIFNLHVSDGHTYEQKTFYNQKEILICILSASGFKNELENILHEDYDYIKTNSKIELLLKRAFVNDVLVENKAFQEYVQQKLVKNANDNWSNAVISLNDSGSKIKVIMQIINRIVHNNSLFYKVGMFTVFIEQFKENCIYFENENYYANLIKLFLTLKKQWACDDYTNLIDFFERRKVSAYIKQQINSEGGVKSIANLWILFSQEYLNFLIETKRFKVLSVLLNEKKCVLQLQNNDNEKFMVFTENDIYHFIVERVDVITKLRESLAEIKNSQGIENVFSEWFREEIISQVLSKSKIFAIQINKLMQECFDLVWGHIINEKDETFEKKDDLNFIINFSSKRKNNKYYKFFYDSTSISKSNAVYYSKLIVVINKYKTYWKKNDYQNIVDFFASKNCLLTNDEAMKTFTKNYKIIIEKYFWLLLYDDNFSAAYQLFKEKRYLKFIDNNFIKANKIFYEQLFDGLMYNNKKDDYDDIFQLSMFYGRKVCVDSVKNIERKINSIFSQKIENINNKCMEIIRGFFNKKNIINNSSYDERELMQIKKYCDFIKYFGDEMQKSEINYRKSILHNIFIKYGRKKNVFTKHNEWLTHLNEAIVVLGARPKSCMYENVSFLTLIIKKNIKEFSQISVHQEIKCDVRKMLCAEIIMDLDACKDSIPAPKDIFVKEKKSIIGEKRLTNTKSKTSNTLNVINNIPSLDLCFQYCQKLVVDLNRELAKKRNKLSSKIKCCISHINNNSMTCKNFNVNYIVWLQRLMRKLKKYFGRAVLIEKVCSDVDKFCEESGIFKEISSGMNQEEMRVAHNYLNLRIRFLIAYEYFKKHEYLSAFKSYSLVKNKLHKMRSDNVALYSKIFQADKEKMKKLQYVWHCRRVSEQLFTHFKKLISMDFRKLLLQEPLIKIINIKAKNIIIILSKKESMVLKEMMFVRGAKNICIDERRLILKVLQKIDMLMKNGEQIKVCDIERINAEIKYDYAMLDLAMKSYAMGKKIGSKNECLLQDNVISILSNKGIKVIDRIFKDVEKVIATLIELAQDKICEVEKKISFLPPLKSYIKLYQLLNIIIKTSLNGGKNKVDKKYAVLSKKLLQAIENFKEKIKNNIKSYEARINLYENKRESERKKFFSPTQIRDGDKLEKYVQEFNARHKKIVPIIMFYKQHKKYIGSENECKQKSPDKIMKK